MTELELKKYIQDKYPQENEHCEWKEFKTLRNHFAGKPGEDVMSYVSAIANMEGGYLVIGVKDKTLDIVGTDTTNCELSKAKLRLKDKCFNLSIEGLDIKEFVTDDTHKVVWIIHIPKHGIRKPVIVHSKGWQRLGDNLVELTPERHHAILAEIDSAEDWSAKIIEGASLSDLDPKAVSLAREKYKDLHSERAQEIDSWDDATFLNKAKITVKGKITNTAIILLGREESEHYLSPAVCKIRWILKNGGDENKDHKIFSIPMIIAIEEISSLIRNTTYTYTISGNIFPESMPRYDMFTIREPLNNAIAHQDYSKHARIELVEYEDDKLLFRNYAQFIPSSIEDVIENDFPVSLYRNPFLVEAMRNIKMVETEGGGIKKLFIQQKKRFFPMPKYDLSNDMVKCEIEGKVLDENFAKILASNPTLTLCEIILLDKVQKHEPITDDALAMLRKKKYVEGRKPNFYLSASIVKNSKHVGLKSSYIKNKGFNDGYFKKLILEYIHKFERASRNDIEQLLDDKLPETLSEEQRFNKITNLLASLRKSNQIAVGDGRNWILVDSKD
jgi:ATP-dependent DNA helicase RecG